MALRRLTAIILCFAFLCIPVKARDTAPVVALTFDDGPSGEITHQLLQGLEKRQVKATFLLCGYRLKEFPQTGQVIFNSGHEIGLHGYSHRTMENMSEAEVAKELADTLALLPDGCSPVFFRPPGGVTTKAVKDAAKAAGLSLLHWSVDPKDWKTHNATTIEQTVMSSVGDGDIILLHDMCSCSVNAALAIVDDLLAQGYRFVTVSELAQLRGTEPRPGLVYSRFR